VSGCCGDWGRVSGCVGLLWLLGSCGWVLSLGVTMVWLCVYLVVNAEGVCLFMSWFVNTEVSPV
jgi:hypothetical protein